MNTIMINDYQVMLDGLEFKIEKFKKQNLITLSLPKPPRRKAGRIKKHKKTHSVTEDIPTPAVSVKIPTTKLPSQSPREGKIQVSYDSNRLGPGFYNAQNKEETRGGYISRVSRFEEPFYFSQAKLERPDISKRNMNLTHFYPENQRRIQEEKIKFKYIKTQIQRQAKELLDQRSQKEFKDRYDKKMSKIEWISKAPMYFFIQKSWGTLFALLGMSCILNRKTQIMKVEYVKKKHFRNLVSHILQFIGKLYRLLRQVRLRKLRQCLTKNISVFRDWIKNKRAKYIDIIDDMADKPFDFSKIFKIMVSFKKKKELCKKCIKNYLAVKEARLVSLTLMINKFQERRKMHKRSQSEIPNLIFEDKQVRELYRVLVHDQLNQGCSYRFHRKYRLIYEYLFGFKRSQRNASLKKF